MNHATRFTKLALLLVVAGTLALAGCGGDDGVNPSVHQEALDAQAAAEAAAAAAAAEQAAAEAAAAEAAAAAAAEEAARIAAEEAAAAAAAEQAAAEEAARMAAEEAAAAAQAEADRMGRIEAAAQLIAMADTPEAAQAAYDAVKDEATFTEGVALQTAVDMRIAELATMDRADSQRMAMSTAAGNVDTSSLMTQAEIDAAQMYIDALVAAIDAAADVSDADKAMYQSTVTAANNAVMAAQTYLDRKNQMAALSSAVTALQAIDLSGLATQGAIDDAQAAIDALQMALDDAADLTDAEKAAAMIELATATRSVMSAQGRVDMESQMAGLSAALTALNMIDLDDLNTQADIDMANMAIKELDDALAAATDLTDAQKLDATVAVTLARRAAMAAQTTLNGNIDTQKMALSTAGMALAAIDLTDLSDQAKIDAAETAVNNLKMALDDATHVSDSEKSMYQSQYDTAYETVKTAKTGMGLMQRMASQRSAITTAVTNAQTAVGMVNDTATDDQVTAADNAIAALEQAIDDADDLPAGDMDVAMAQGTLNTLKGLLASAKSSRMTAEADRKANEIAAMAATAAKLHAGIYAPAADATGTGTDDVHAAYNDANDTTGVVNGIPAGAAADTLIMVTRGTGGDSPAAGTPVPLSEDKDTPVAALHGWTGKRYARTTMSATMGTYEAIVYSHVGEPTMGDKFGQIGVTTGAEGYQYGLDTDGFLVADGGGAFTWVATQIASSSFDQSAGVKSFELGTNRQYVSISGTYHGVAGEYRCTPGANTCAAQVAANGFNLGGVTDADPPVFAAANATWLFKPANPEARVMSTPDASYASYGWWLHTAADGDLTASAFVDRRGAADPASGLNALNGTATYQGGAVGKYALSSTTGGTNDAGHFTARATLEANFTTASGDTVDDAITGTIDMFVGADGESRDWTVKLNGSPITDVGVIGDAAATDGTEWTIGGMAADDSGNWTGSLQENGDDGVPAIATGTFYTEYGTAGKMVGAFGANEQ